MFARPPSKDAGGNQCEIGQVLFVFASEAPTGVNAVSHDQGCDAQVLRLLVALPEAAVTLPENADEDATTAYSVNGVFAELFVASGAIAAAASLACH